MDLVPWIRDFGEVADWTAEAAGNNRRSVVSRKRLLPAISLAVLLAVAAPAAPAAAFTPGSAGAGDPFFPLAGNGGYEVRHYSLRLDYEPRNNALDARAVISARATQDLSRFDLDLRGLHVGQVTVGGDRRRLQAGGPGARDHAGRRHPQRPRLRGRSRLPTATRTRSSTRTSRRTAGSRPMTAPSSSTSRRDRPAGIPPTTRRRTRPPSTSRSPCPRAAPRSPTACSWARPTTATPTTWRWRASDPTAPYLATATNGVFETRFGTLPNGLPEYNAVDPQTRRFGTKDPNPELAWQRLALNGPAVDLFSELYGAVPVRERRRRGGLGAERLLLARVADAADVLARAERGHSGARDRAHVVRQLGHAGALAGHLAERGLRDLVGVDLVRAHGAAARAQRRSSTSCTPPRRTRTPARTSGSPRRPRCPARRRCSTRPCTTAAR